MSAVVKNGIGGARVEIFDTMTNMTTPVPTTTSESHIASYRHFSYIYSQYSLPARVPLDGFWSRTAAARGSIYYCASGLGVMLMCLVFLYMVFSSSVSASAAMVLVLSASLVLLEDVVYMTIC